MATLLRRSPALRLLQRRHGNLKSAFSVVAQTKSALSLVSGACELPHPQKRATGGEDAWFICSNTVGVADGVGGWARKVNCLALALSSPDEGLQGIDSGEYSRTLMNSAHAALGLLAPASTDDTLPSPLDVLKYAHGKAHCQGSSTACIVQLHDDALRAVNLGDSGFLLCRLLPEEDSEGGEERLKWHVVYEAPHQCHYFNCPFQLGYENGDMPENGQLIDLPTQAGDLVVLGTDGLFDNLFPAQITSLLDTVLPSSPEMDLQSMSKVASCIAHTAHMAAKGTKNATPFALSAKQAGYQYMGGKMDDITVVTSLVAAAT